MFISVGDIDQN